MTGETHSASLLGICGHLRALELHLEIAETYMFEKAHPGLDERAKVPACGFSDICLHLSYLVLCRLPRCCWFALIKLGALCRPFVGFCHFCTAEWPAVLMRAQMVQNSVCMHSVMYLLLLLLNAHFSFPCLVAACRQRPSVPSGVGEARSGSHCWSNRGNLNYCVRGLLHRSCMVLISPFCRRHATGHDCTDETRTWGC